MIGRRIDQEVPAGVVPDGAATQVDAIRRPIRIAGKTFATEPTNFTDRSRMFGKVLLRKDHEAGDINLIPQERLAYIRKLVRFAKLAGRIDVMQAALDALGNEIMEFNAAHPPLRGGELFRLGKSVTEIPEVTSKPDLDRVREAAGTSFPKYGTEEVVLVAMIPEEPLRSGILLRGEEIEDELHAAFHDMGMNDAEIAKQVAVIRRMNVTDKEALYQAVNAGIIPEDAVNAVSKGKVKALPLPKERVKKPRAPKAKTIVSEGTTS